MQQLITILGVMQVDAASFLDLYAPGLVEGIPEAQELKLVKAAEREAEKDQQLVAAEAALICLKSLVYGLTHSAGSSSPPRDLSLLQTSVAAESATPASVVVVVVSAAAVRHLGLVGEAL